MTRDHRPLLQPLRSERGAFDLPAIIVGVVVVGILAVGVLASVFGIIPFAQDNAAKQDAMAIRTAEGVAKAKDGRYMDTAGLVAAGYLPQPALKAQAEPAPGGSGISLVAATGTYSWTVSADAAGTCFVGVTHSGTGSLFYTSSRVGDPQELTPATDTTCPTTASTTSMATTVGGYPAKYIAAAPGGLAVSSTTFTSASLTWTAAAGATGYKVEASVNGGAWTTVASNQPGTSYTVAGNAGDQISLRVSSVNAAGTSAPCNAVTASLPALSAPAGLTGSSTSNTSAAFSWSTAAGATGYKVEASVNGGAWTVATANQPGTSYTATGNAGNTISVRVSSVGSGSTSAPSAPVAVALPTGPNFAAPISWTKTGSTGSWLAVASSSDGTKLVAIQSAGIWRSTDTGATWTKLAGPAGVSSGFAAVASSSDGTHLAAASGYYVYTSADSGATWTHGPALGYVPNSLSSSGDGTKLIASPYNGLTYVSTNSGATWTAVTAIGNQYWNGVSVSADGSTMVAGSGFDNYLHISHDSGTTWTKTFSGSGGAAWGPSATSANGQTIYAIQQGNLDVSTDGGKTFALAEAVSKQGITSVATSADGTKVLASIGSNVVGSPGGLTLYASTDTGKTWTTQTSAGAGSWTGVASSADGSKLIASASGASGFLVTGSYPG